MSKTIDIRFNTNFPEKSQYEWRIIYVSDAPFGDKDAEVLVNEFQIHSLPCYSHSRFIEGEGMKHHVRVDANDVQIIYKEGRKIAYIQ